MEWEVQRTKIFVANDKRQSVKGIVILDETEILEYKTSK